ncbi:MAG: hypothetical protein ACUZ8O_15250 [Candidatus Anammoxibacter sp.]
MTQCLKTFMDKAIDYAGLFPPAILPMDKALVNYNEYRDSPDSWMLSRFICPAARLNEFEAVSGKLSQKREPYRISALGRKSNEPESFLENIQKDAEAIKRFVECNPGKAIVDAFEVCLPSDITTQTGRLDEIVGSAKEAIISYTNSPYPVTVYYEASLGQAWQNEINSVISAIARHNSSSIKENASEKSSSIGFKFRCGGVKAEQFHSVNQMVCCIKSCINEGVRLKLTAGLHHPFRHFNETVQTKMHGFVNIFAAVLLGIEHRLDEDTLSRIIEDEDHSNFRFNKESLCWNDLDITIDRITEGRNNAIISFGCCSFDEPQDDLRKLGLL